MFFNLKIFFIGCLHIFPTCWRIDVTIADKKLSNLGEYPNLRLLSKEWSYFSSRSRSFGLYHEFIITGEGLQKF